MNRKVFGTAAGPGWFFGGALGIPVSGTPLGFRGRPKLVLAIVPVAVGAMLFWFFTTLP